MIRFVTQGLLAAFLLFFYSIALNADVRINPAIQLVVETDKNQLYQHSQLLINLHIFHQDPLPESVDIIPPQLDEGRVRTLGLPHTRVEPGPGAVAYHTTQSYALFPTQPGNLLTTGPSLRIPSPLNNESQIITADIPFVNVLAMPDGIERLSSENLILSDTAHPLANPELGYIRRISITAVATLPHQLPDRILAPSHQQNYQLIERYIDEFHSRQGVTSLLQELWHVTPTPNTSTSQPISSIVWWDTESQTLRQTQSPLPTMAMAELTEPENSAEIPEVLSDSLDEPEKLTVATANETTSFWLQVGVGFTLLSVVSLAILAGFKFQLSRTAQNKPSRSEPKDRPKKAANVTDNHNNRTAIDVNRLKANAELNAFQGLTSACQQNDCQQAKTAIVLLAACFWPDKRIAKTESIYQANISQTLNYLLLDLEHHIQQSQEDAWRGDLLLEAVKTLRRRRMK